MIDLFECERLSAKISRAQCEVNRLRVDNGRIDVLAISACKGCPGLGAAVNIEAKEGFVLDKICSVKGCGKKVHARGMCWRHERSVLGVDPATGHPLKMQNVLISADAEKVIDQVEKAAKVQVKEILKPESCCGECGTSPCVCVKAVPDGFDSAVVNDEVPEQVAIPTLMIEAGVRTIGGPETAIVRALRDVWAEKEKSFLAELAPLRPCAAIVRAASMIKAVEGLVY